MLAIIRKFPFFKSIRNTFELEVIICVVLAAVVIVTDITSRSVSPGCCRAFGNKFFKFSSLKNLESRTGFIPVAFSKTYFDRAIKNLIVVRCFALSKCFVFGAVPKDLMFPIFQFLGPIRFVKQCFIRKELAFIGTMQDSSFQYVSAIHDWIVQLFLIYLAQQFLEYMIPEELLSWAIQHELFELPTQQRSSADNWYVYGPKLRYALTFIDKKEVFERLNINPTFKVTIFGLFRLYLEVKLALDSTFSLFIQFINRYCQVNEGVLVFNNRLAMQICRWKSLKVLSSADSKQKQYLKGILSLSGSELRAQLSSLIGPRLIILFLIKYLLVLKESSKLKL